MIYSTLQYVFAGIAVLSGALAFGLRSKRSVFIVNALTAFFAFVAAHYQVFWATAVFGLCIPWVLVCALPTIDIAWRAKTGFVLFLALGAGLSIYPTYHDERLGRLDRGTLKGPELEKIEQDALRGDRGIREWLLTNINFRLVRGLDLKGGMRLVYTVDVDEAIKDKRDRNYDDLRTSLARTFDIIPKDKQPAGEDLKKLAAKVRLEKSRDQAGLITLHFENADDANKINEEFMTPYARELQRQFSADHKDVTLRIKSEIESEIRDKAVAKAKDTVLRRVDSMGLKEASVTTRDEDIIIEIPGDDEKSFKHIKDIIAQTARLEFKMLDDDTNFFEQEVRNPNNQKVAGLSFESEQVSVGPGKQKVSYFATLRRAEGEKMVDALARMKEWAATLSVPDDHQIGFGKWQAYDAEKGTIEERGWRTYYLFSKAEITGDMVREAQAMPDPSDRGLGGWLVRMTMTPKGGDIFEDITGRNIKRRFAIILDSKVESAPVIQTKIPGGIATITMGSANVDQQVQDARNLELVLNSGALPAPISPSNEQAIEASLGQDAIVQGLKATVAGGALVIIFMMAYYSRAGVIANIAVIFNAILQIAILAMFGASMTLPGLAGITLTIGIAVDANVLINERIREELRNGKSARAAVDIGYDKAFSAILDGHVTTLISGLILATYGSGPIKGFAITLIVGIVVSLFTGVVCTRLMFDWAVRGRRVKKLYLG